MCALVGVFAGSGASARAVITHEFLPEPSKKITEGVPAGSGASLTGPLVNVNALAVDSGRLWVAEELGSIGGSRVDGFDAATGVFVSPQLNGEAGVKSLTQGVAVGSVAGEPQVYVGATHEVKGSPDGVVGVFGASGKLQGTWTGESTQNGSFTEMGGFSVAELTGVAVDRSANPETTGDVYVSTRGGSAASFNVVDVFKPEVAGVEPGKAGVRQLTGTCVSPGTCPGEVVPFSRPLGVAVSGFNSDVLVTDNHNTIDVFEPTVLGEYGFVRQLTGTPTGPEGVEVAFSDIASVAVDGSNGDIYVVDRAAVQVVDEFDREGVYLGHLTGTPAGRFGRPLASPQGVAVDRETGHVFVSVYNEEIGRGAVDVFGGNIVLADVATSAASGQSVDAKGVIGATLNGTVNPNGEGEVSCRFVWGTSGAFGHVAACEPEHVPDGGVPVPVHARIGGLAPDTRYFYRLEASNKNGVNPGEESQDREFVSSGPGLRAESVSGVAASSGTLEATIDPHGAPTSYYFEYGRTAAYEVQVPVAPGFPLGSGEGDLEVSRHVQGLLADTTYHFRVVAVSELEVAPGEVRQVSFTEPDRTFLTQRVGGASSLPDARAWELVSPPDKHGALIAPLGDSGPVIQSAAAGGVVTYQANLPTEASVPGYSENVQVISSRGGDGWSSHDISLPHPTAVGQGAGGGPEYRFFSEDLSLGLVEPQGAFSSLVPDSSPPDSERTAYLRHNDTCVSIPATCFQPLVTGAPGYENVPPGTKFGGENQTGATKFVGGSPDLAHVLFWSGVPLTSTPFPVGGGGELYEWSAGEPAAEQLQLVSVLPNGGGPAKEPELGVENQATSGAVSADGKRIVWIEFQSRHLYLTDMSSGQARTVGLDVPEAACLASKECGEHEVNPEYAFASSDGSRVFFSDQQRLTKDSGRIPHRSDLYECRIVEVAGELRCDLSDLTPSSATGAPGKIYGVVGASRDGSWVYFVAGGVFGDAGEKGAGQGNCEQSEGTCNLYVWHEGAVKLVAVVSADDQPDWNNVNPAHDVGRVSPDGRSLVFMSDRNLTGYDTRDAVSGKPDEEVYVYNVEASGEGRLACASCDPTGARPVGVEYEKLNGELVGGARVWPLNRWIAANVATWTTYALERGLYQPRYLSDGGRVFFDTNDALVSQDINGDEDVYEFEPVGVGDCSDASVTFSGVSGGCVSLISSGTAVGESAFMDASENGSDVYFLTGERLVSGDVDSLLDLYDAHVCSTTAPCTGSPVGSPACTTADACRSAPLPQPGVFGSPSSATFSGAGNVTPSGATAVKAKSLTRAQKLVRALSACRAKKNRHKRNGCERQAHKRYGAKRAGKANTGKKGNG